MTRNDWSLLLRKMQSLEDSGDTESAHGLADDLLVAALRLLPQLKEPDDISAEEVEDLITAYEAVDKWFA